MAAIFNIYNKLESTYWKPVNFNVVGDQVNVKKIPVLFDNNRYGRWNKGAGLIQKWLHNKNILNNYEYIIFFEARLELLSHYFFDKFFI